MKFFPFPLSGLSLSCFVLLTVGPIQALADPFENVLKRTSAFSGACAETYSSRVYSVYNEKAVGEVKTELEENLAASVRELRKTDRLFGGIFEGLDEQSEQAKAIGLEDDIPAKITLAIVWRSFAFQWRFISKICDEMLKRLPKLNQSPEQAKEAQILFVSRVLEEFKENTGYSIFTLQEMNKSGDRKILQFIALYSSIGKRIQNEEKLPLEDLSKLMLDGYELFSDLPDFYESLSIQFETFEIYESFRSLKVGFANSRHAKSCVAGSGRYLKHLREATIKFKQNKLLEKSANQFGPEYIFEKLPQQLKSNNHEATLDLLELTNDWFTTDVNSPADLAMGLLRNFLRNLNNVGKRTVDSIFFEFMNGIPNGSFVPEVIQRKPVVQKAQRPSKKSPAKHQPNRDLPGVTEAPPSTGVEAALVVKDEPVGESPFGRVDEEENLIAKVDLDGFVQIMNEAVKVSEVSAKDDFSKRKNERPRSHSKDAPQGPALKTIRLTGGAARVFAIASGQAFSQFQVRNRDFLDLLNQLGGGMVGNKGNGSAKSYYLPNLKENRLEKPFRLFLLHWRHNGKEPFNPKTLKYRLGSALAKAGYIDNPSVKVELEL